MKRHHTEAGQIRGVAASWLRDAKTGLILPGSYSEDRNTVMLEAMEVFLSRLRYIAPSALQIKQIAVGIGTTAVVNTDLSLVSSTLAKDIDSWDDSGFASVPRSTKAVLQFGTGEANAELAEVGALFDDGSLVSRVLFGQGSITGATKANPCVVTSAAHGLTDGDRVLIEAVGGMTALNGVYFYVDVLSSSTFALYSNAGLTSAVNSSAYGAYTSGGTWTKIKKKTSSAVFVVNYSYSLA